MYYPYFTHARMNDDYDSWMNYDYDSGMSDDYDSWMNDDYDSWMNDVWIIIILFVMNTYLIVIHDRINL